MVKMLFFADKYHLQRYAKPILGDIYLKLPFGPVPTLTLNTINSMNRKDNSDFESYKNKLTEYVDLKEKEGQHNNIVFTKKKDFNKNLFSKSEINVLKEVFEEFKNSTASEVSRRSHKTEEYQNASDNSIISYSSMAGSKMSDYISFWDRENREFESILSRG
ncbi:MAG: Panacea domain-containing protein [Campylobacterota bacterium]|nr:Panacea domain-containing protein [Campylobacterota bacterium]